MSLPALAAPPDPPELPEAARPRWPVWHGPVALVTAIAALFTLGSPLIPVFLVGRLSETAAAVALLVALLFQDGVVVGAALLFASFERAPRAWHFGVRATRFWPTPAGPRSAAGSRSGSRSPGSPCSTSTRRT
jgi:hypothetical protein